MRLSEVTQTNPVNDDLWTKEQIDNFFDWNNHCKNTHFNPDGSVDVEGEFRSFHKFTFNRLPFRIRKLTGDLTFTHNESLTNLRGFPVEVTGSVRLNVLRNLGSLQHFPAKVGETVWIENCNALDDIKGLPPIINGDFLLKNLGKYYDLDHLPNQINGSFGITGENLKKLFLLKIFKVTGITNIKITDLNLINFSVKTNEKTSKLLKLNELFNKYYKKGRDMLNCQDELIEAGLEEYAEIE